MDPVMWQRLRGLAGRAYRRHLRREIDDVPDHVAVIQDGNRRYAREQGDDAPEGHRAGADTTEQVLDWCADLGVSELTLYAFSTENFERPDEELEPPRRRGHHRTSPRLVRRPRRLGAHPLRLLHRELRAPGRGAGTPLRPARTQAARVRRRRPRPR
ncbi:hypothetical protein DJ79_00305 [Halorubrum ezzemoulense]|uniref:UDP diphosphate synthase n=1 Tax=Halorubrum ezzemoulense TaxID=337243 RepID=A0A256JPJ8_HALEZ|nr:hypothetical protein DJ79_00305 [Halorubrum ezzemoulense]